MASRLDFYKLKTPIFEGMGIEDDIAKLLRPKVWLKSGAYLIIEKTEAMVVVDVNSGRFIGKKNHEENSLKINLEACKEVARQLRLRDLSGLVVIDFIDMLSLKNKRAVEDKLWNALSIDRAKVQVGRISRFGLLEIGCQSEFSGDDDDEEIMCPHCGMIGDTPLTGK